MPQPYTSILKSAFLLTYEKESNCARVRVLLSNSMFHIPL